MIWLVSGSVRHVRRSVYPSTHPVAKGIRWQWSGDQHGCWHDYDFEVAAVLEDELQKGTPTIDLSTKFPMMQYKVDLHVMEQYKLNTGFVRSVKRLTNHAFKYQSASGAVPTRGSTFTFGSTHSSASGNPPPPLAVTSKAGSFSFGMPLLSHPFTLGSPHSVPSSAGPSLLFNPGFPSSGPPPSLHNGYPSGIRLYIVPCMHPASVAIHAYNFQFHLCCTLIDVSTNVNRFYHFNDKACCHFWKAWSNAM